MKKFGFLLLSALIALPVNAAISSAAGKPTTLPTPAAKNSPTAKPKSENKATVDAKSAPTSAPSSASNKPVAGNNAANANEKAKQNANSNSAVSKSETASETETVDNGPTKRYIIRYNDNSLLTLEVKDLSDKKVKVDRTFSKVFKGAVANLTDKQVEALKKNPNLADIELDAQVTTLDYQSTSSWGLDRIDQRNLPLDSGFTYSSNGSNSKIYIVDTGIKSTHTELAGRVQSGYTAIADGEGTNDCNGHGTHVSGIAAGSSVGVAKAAALIPVRVLDCTGSGSISGVISGLDWIAANSASGAPAVVNMSLGGGASSTLDSAVNNLISRGITVVVAAGNSTADACLSSPSRVSGAITVAASANGDGFATYSNYGSCVDIIAPGTGIYSSWNTSDSAYATLSGTSMATPFVTGYVAAVLSGGYQTAASISTLLKSSATNNAITSVKGSTPNLLLYTNNVTTTPTTPTATVPSAPTNLVAVAQKRAASLSWQSALDNGAPITSQTLRIYSGGKVVATKTITATATSLSVSGLNSNTTYTFTIAAVNSVGAGAESAPSNAIKPLK